MTTEQTNSEIEASVIILGLAYALVLGVANALALMSLIGLLHVV